MAPIVAPMSIYLFMDKNYSLMILSILLAMLSGVTEKMRIERKNGTIKKESCEKMAPLVSSYLLHTKKFQIV